MVTSNEPLFWELWSLLITTKIFRRQSGKESGKEDKEEDILSEQRVVELIIGKLPKCLQSSHLRQTVNRFLLCWAFVESIGSVSIHSWWKRHINSSSNYFAMNLSSPKRKYNSIKYSKQILHVLYMLKLSHSLGSNTSSEFEKYTKCYI